MENVGKYTEGNIDWLRFILLIAIWIILKLLIIYFLNVRSNPCSRSFKNKIEVEKSLEDNQIEIDELPKRSFTTDFSRGSNISTDSMKIPLPKSRSSSIPAKKKNQLKR